VNNGRMTFRFDLDEDKRKETEPWHGSEIRNAKEYAEVNHELDILQEPSPAWPEPEIVEHAARFEEDRERILYEDVAFPVGMYSGAYHSRRPSSWWKFAASVTAALSTGLLFGYVALSFFRGNDVPDPAITGSSNTIVADEQSSGGVLDPAGTGTSGLPISADSAAVERIPVQVAGQSYFLLQYGVFSTPDGASQAKQELLTAGLAAGLDPAEGNRVYAGISPDREQAKLLSNGLKSQGIELYVREVELPAASELAFGGTAETVNHYFEVSGRLLGELSSITASLLNNGSAQQTADVSNLHLEWTEAVKALEGGLPPAALSIAAEQEKAISQGIAALSEYQKNKSDGLLWEVQGSMMNFLTGQKKLLDVLS
jgi:hypothetical protein